MCAISFRPSLVLAAMSLTALALLGCKQDIGQRCEQGSDCSSGYCGNSTLGMVSVMGRVCTPPPTAGLFPDSGTAGDAADASTEVGDAASDSTSDGPSDDAADSASDGGSGEAPPDDARADSPDPDGG
jgi:hypothetical protein